jgi:hypothetical protein
MKNYLSSPLLFVIGSLTGSLMVALIAGCSDSNPEQGAPGPSAAIPANQQANTPPSQPDPAASLTPFTPSKPEANATIKVGATKIQINDENVSTLHCNWRKSATPPILTISIEGKDHTFQATLQNFTTNILSGAASTFHFHSDEKDTDSTVSIQSTEDFRDRYDSNPESGSDCTFSFQMKGGQVLGKFTCKNLFSEENGSSVTATGTFSCDGSRQ